MKIEYGLLGVKDGKRQAFTVSHACCFGSIGSVLYDMDWVALTWSDRRPMLEGVRWIPYKAVISCDETKADFNKWARRLRKEFPTYRVNGVDHKAPTMVYYDVDSRQSGHLNENGAGPMVKTDRRRSYVILTFPKGTTNDVMYIGLKFYMKNLMNPKGTNQGKQTSALWAEAERQLVQAGIEKPTMGMIMAVNSMSNPSHTIGYQWPVFSGEVSKAALKEFCENKYETADFNDNNKFLHIDSEFGIYNSKSAIKGLSRPRIAQGTIMPPVHGYDQAVKRIIEVMA